MCSIRKQIIIFCSSTNANVDYLSSLPPSQVTTFLNQVEEERDGNKFSKHEGGENFAQRELRKKILEKCNGGSSHEG